MAIGRAGSYATTQAPTDNILQSMQYVDQLDYRAKQDEAKAAAAKAKKDAENLKEIEDYRNKFPINLTGNQSINDLTIPYASQARDRAAELTRKIQSTNNPQEKEKYMRERNNVVQSFDILKQVPDILIAKTKEISDGVEKGKYNERDIDAVQEVLGQLETGKATLYVDEYGQPRATIFKTDEQGNPTKIMEKDLSMAELINSATPFLKPTYDAKSGIAEQFLSQVKLDEKSVQNGFTTISQTQLTDRVKNLAKQKGKEIATIDSEVYEIWQRMGNEPKRKFTDEDKQKVASYVEKDLLARYNSEYKKDIDQSGALANKKFNAEEKEKKASFGQVEVPTAITGAGYKPKAGYKAVSVRNGRPFNILAGQTFATVNSYTVTTDGTGKERIIAEIVYPDIKTSSLTPQEQNIFDKLEKNPESLTESEKLVVSRVTTGAVNKTKIVTLDEADSDKLAGQIGLNNPKEVRDAAKYKDVNEKSERQTWDDAYNKGPKSTKTEAENLGI